MKSPRTPRDETSAPPPGEQRAAELAAFARSLGLEVPHAKLGILERATIHRSFRVEAGLRADNERLEFLGDSVISVATTSLLLRLHPEKSEGDLSKLRAAAVSRNTLGRIGVALGVGGVLLLGSGEDRQGGRDRLSTIGSALEAIVGALYLSIPWDELRPVIEQKIVHPAIAASGDAVVVDFKSRLQEILQASGKTRLQYAVAEESGPDHDKHFVVEALLEGREIGRGSGPRKRSAENAAARDALERMGFAV